MYILAFLGSNTFNNIVHRLLQTLVKISKLFKFYIPNKLKLFHYKVLKVRYITTFTILNCRDHFIILKSKNDDDILFCFDCDILLCYYSRDPKIYGSTYSKESFFVIPVGTRKQFFDLILTI